jgi:hypothetical protein
LNETRVNLRDELEEALLSMREEPPKPMISLEALRDEIHRIRAHSQENMTINADLIEV